MLFTYEKSITYKQGFIDQLIIRFGDDYTRIKFETVSDGEGNDTDFMYVTMSDTFTNADLLNQLVDNYMDIPHASDYASIYERRQNYRRTLLDNTMADIVITIAVNDGITSSDAEKIGARMFYEEFGGLGGGDLWIWILGGYIVPNGALEMPLIEKLNNSTISELDYNSIEDPSKTLRQRLMDAFLEVG